MPLPTSKTRRMVYLTGALMAVIGLGSVAHYLARTPLVVDKSHISINALGQRIYQGQPFTGEVVSFHDASHLASSEQFNNGRRHGHLQTWFSNGVLGYEAQFEQGKRQGKVSSWWRNGNLRSVTFYVNDLPEGEAWQWYRSGEKFKRMHFAAGQAVGLQQGWRLNGKLFSNYEYKEGRIFGLSNANLCVELNDEKIAFSN